MLGKNSYLLQQADPDPDPIHSLDLLSAHYLTHQNPPPILEPTVPYSEDACQGPSGPKSTKKDRHSKINTAQGPRDRRVRLSIGVARKFFDLQEVLGFDKPSKTLDWLLTKSRSAIKHLVASKSSVISSDDDESDQINNNLTQEKKRSEKKGKSSKKNNNNNSSQQLAAKESRAKARARARERTWEKMCVKQRILGTTSSTTGNYNNNHDLLHNYINGQLEACRAYELHNHDDLIRESEAAANKRKVNAAQTSLTFGFDNNSAPCPYSSSVGEGGCWDNMANFESSLSAILDQHKFNVRYSNN